MKKTVCMMISKDNYHKINIIATVRKNYTDDVHSSMSSIIDDAITEYLINHEDEIKKMMDEYHEQGGCFEL